MIIPYFIKMRRTALLGVLMLLCVCSSYAQEFTPFARTYPSGNNFRFQSNLRGDLTFIGNNILNRDNGVAEEGPNDPYNNLMSNTDDFAGTNNDTNGFFNVNDFKQMFYVDVDGDPTTFSSSSSTFNFPQADCNLIRYAGLYWAGTYPSATANGFVNDAFGDFSQNNVPVGTGRQNDFNQVRFQVPGGTYVDITADEVIFDGFTSTDNAIRENSPYACYADVTALVTAMADPQGIYTVANVRATEGGMFGSGGSSAGWMLVIVYENPTLSGKLISTFDGFARVNDTNSVDIDYSGFETIPAGPVNVSLGAGTLEGDFRIVGDGLSLEGTPLSNALNPVDNFFNSNITLDGVDLAGRTPSSLNTLGYDADIFLLNNPLNSVIANSQTAATFTFSTNGDQYFPFFNSFNVEVIEPNIVLEKRVEDIAGNDITGAGVNLGQLLDYVLTFQNVGNDDGTNYTIRDVLPINVTLDTDYLDNNLPPGVTYVFDAPSRTVTFTVPDNLIQENDPSSNIRMRVQVAENCFDFIDACTDLIENLAFSTYQGIINTAVITDDPSVNDFDDCGFVTPGATNFLLDDLESCDFSRSLQLCGESILLDAGNNFDNYIWYVDENGDGLIDAGDTEIVGENTDTLLVTEPGTYIVDKIVADPCKGFQEIITVTQFGITQTNPIIDLINDTSNTVEGEVVVCPNDGEELPEIFLCGLNDTELIQLNIPDAESIVWEQLDEASCAPATDDCANRNNTCTWNNVATGGDFLASDAGQYRVVINYANGCFTRFYFNIFKNLLDPQFNSRDIICTTPGNITVTNVPTDYEFQLVDTTDDSILVPFNPNPSFDITTNGAYRVELRQQGVVDGCIFVLDNIGILNRDFQVDVTPRDSDCNGLGEIQISVLNVEPQYYYEISQGGTVVDTFGPSADNNHTFPNLNPGVYDVEATTDDGCIYNEQVTIVDRTDLDVTANLTKNIDCTDGIITVTGSGGFPNPEYSYAIWSIDGVDQYTDVTDIPASAFQSTNDFFFTNGEEGDYEFIVVDGNLCSFVSNVVSIVVSPAVEYTTTQTDELCFAAADGSFAVNVTNSNGYTLSFTLTFPDTSTVSNASGTFTGLGQGDYSLAITQSQGGVSCDFVETFTIGGPTATIAADLVQTQDYTCLQTATVEVQNVSGGTAPYEFSIDGVNFVNGPGAETFTGLTDGTYTVTVRDVNGCTFVTNAIVVAPLNPPTDIAFSATTPSCPALTSDVTLTVVDGTAPFNFEIIAPAASIANNGTNNVFSGLAPGTYTFRVTDANDCTLDESFTIDPVSPIAVLGQLIQNISCFDDTDGEARFTVSGFNADYDYSVTGPATFNGTNETNTTIDLTGLDDGTYTITVTDNVTSCTATTDVVISAPTAALTITDLDVTDLTCSTTGTVPGSVRITAADGWGGFEYELEDPAGGVTGPQASNTFSGLTDTSGNYTVTVRDAGGCEVTQTFNLTPTVAPVLDVTANSLCYDSATGLELTANVTSGGTAPFQYRLNGGAFQTNPVFTGLGPGSYTVEVIDNRNCTATASIDVFPTLNASASLVKDLDCSATPDAEIAIDLTGGNPTFTFEVFLNGASFQASAAVPSVPFSFFTTTPGTYTFTITDSESCTYTTNQVVVTDNPPPAVSPIVTDVLCNGDSNGAVDLNVSGGLAPYSIVFDGSAPSTQQVYAGLAAGTYTYTVTDSKNCVTTNTVTVDEPVVLSLSSTITVALDCNTTATIDVTATNGGTAPYTYSIDGVNFSNTTSFTGLVDGTHTITVRDANNCTATSVQTILPLNPPTNLSFAQTAVTCPSLQSDVTVTVTDGVAPFTFEIIAPAGSVVNNGNAATFTALAPGTYTFRVTDANACVVTEDYTIADIPQVDAIAQLERNITCLGDTDGAFNFTVSDFDTTYSFVVQDGGGATVTSANNSNTTTPISVTGLGADTYSVIITDDVTNCTITVTQVIAAPPAALDFTFTNTDDTCITDATVTVTAFDGWGGYEYQLEDTVGPSIIYPFQSGSSFADVAPGTYTIYVRDANGCVRTRPITIDPAETPVIAFNPSDICFDATNQASLEVSITDGVAPYSYTINGGAPIATGGNPFTINNLTPGTYNIQVTDAFGCVSNSINQTIAPQLTANAVLTQDLFCTANAIIDVTINGGYTPYATYQVQVDGGGYGATTPITGNTFTFNGAGTAGTYQFLILDNNNCSVETNEVVVSPTVNPQATAVVADAACFGFADGSVVIDIDENFGVAPYTVSFNGSAFTATRSYSGLAAGTYPYVVRDSRGCEFTDDAIVGEPLQIISNLSSTDVTCDPLTGISVLGSVDVTITQGGIPNFTYLLYDSTNALINTVVSASTTHTFAGIDFGDYHVRIIDANGCESDLGSVRVSSNPFLTLTANPAPSDCITGGSVDITASGGSGNYDFEIFDGGPGPTTEVATPPDTEVATFTGLNPGQTYIIRAQDVINGCVSFLEVTIPPVSTISVVVNPTTNITCVGEMDGTMTFTVDNYDPGVTSIDWEILNALSNTPVIGPGTYTGTVGPGPAGGPQVETVTQLPPGDFVLVVREATAPSCTTTDTFRIVEPSATNVSLTSQLAGNCFSDAEVTVRATGGTGPYSYAYVVDGAAAPTTFPEGQTFTLDPATSLDWDIYAQDANGCVSAPLDVTITVDATPEISAAIADACVTEGNFAVDVTLTALGVAPYSIRVDGGAPQATTWTNIGDVVTISNLSSGNHSFQIVDANGCGELENITIFPPLEVLANITVDENCDPANTGEVTITANGGSGVYSFTQTIPAGATNATGIFTGLTHSVAYTFEVEDTNTGCVVPVSITLPAPVDPTFSLAKTDVSCFGGNDGTITVTLDPGNIDVPYLYSLDGGTTTQASNIFTGLTQGNYNVTVISASGCDHTLPITIDEPSQLDIAASASAFSCNDAASTITVTINNDGTGNPSGTAPYQYSFDGGTNFSSDNTFVVAYGSANVSVVVRDNNGCTDTVSVPVPATQEVMAVINEIQDITCANGQEIIEIVASNGSGNYTYAQQPSGTIVADPTNIIITAPGTYVYEITDTTTNCSVTVEHIVAPFDLINAVATVSADATCSDATDGTLDVTLSGYTGTFDYVVLDNLGNPIAGTNDADNATTDPYTFTVSTNLGAGTYSIRVTETADPFCVTTTNPVTIDAPQPLDLVLLANVNANCNAPTAIVTVQASGGTAPYSYGASQSGAGVPATFPFDTTIELDPLTATDWDIYVSDANGCIIAAPLAVTIAMDTSPDISLAIVDECADEGTFEISVGLDAINTGIAPYTMSLDGGAFQNIAGFPHTYTGLSSGAHTVEIRDANGCGELENITIEPELQLTATPNTQPSCGANDGIIDFTVTGGSGTSTIQLLRTDLTDTGLVPVGNQFVGVAFGDYILRVTDNALGTPNCFADAPVSLEEPTPVTLLATEKTDVSCAGADDGTITVNLAPSGPGVNDNPPYVYEITDGVSTFTQNNGVFTNLPDGTYDITVTSNRLCVATDQIVIDAPLALDAAITNVVEFSCNPNNTVAAASIEITITAGTGTPDYFYSVNGGAFVPTGGNVFSHLTAVAGNFDFVIRDANGCTFPLPTQTIEPLNTFTVDVSQNIAISCVNPEEVLLTVTDNGNPTNAYTYELLPIGNPNGTLTGTPTNVTATFELSVPDTYVFRVTDTATGCFVDTAPYSVAPFDLIDVIATPTAPVVCFGDSNGALEINVTGYSGPYDFEVFTQAGGSVLTGSGNTATNPLSIPGLSGGNYFVRVTQTNNPLCVEDSNIVTIFSPDMMLDATPVEVANVSCTNDQGEIIVDPIGGVAPYDIVLTNTTTVFTHPAVVGVTSHLFTGLDEGTYDVQITDSQGCIINRPVTLTAPLPITAAIDATPTTLQCFGDTNATVMAINVMGGSGTYLYQLNVFANFGDTTPTFTSGTQANDTFANLGGGVYSITISDGLNCGITTNQVEIFEPTEVMASLIQIRPLTCTTQAQISLSAIGGSAPYFFSSDGINFNAMSGGDTHTFDVGAGEYQFFVRDNFGCEAMISNQVTVDMVPPLAITLDESAAVINCTGEASAFIFATATGGLGNYVYELLDAPASTTPLATNTTGVFENLLAGNYFVRVISDDCVEVEAVAPIVDPVPLQIEREEFTNVTCSGEEDGTITVELSGGTGEILYAITPNLNQFDTVNTFTDLAPGVYDVIAQDERGCFIPFQFTIIEPSPIEISTVTLQNEVCEGSEDGSVEIAISGGTAPYRSSFNSNDDNNFVADQTQFNDLAAGTYVIFVRDANDCESNIIVEIDPGVNLNATVLPIYECNGLVPDNRLEVTLEDVSVSNDVLYNIDSTDLSTMISSPDFNGLAPGSHTLTIAHANGCMNIIPFEIQGFDPLSLTLEQNNINEITAVAEGGLEDYTFFFDGVDNGTDNTIFINRTDTYTVTVVDANGCETTADIFMEFIDIEVPDFFTPDGDGLNDRWVPENLEAFPNVLILIFDRYGRELYRMKIDSVPWDGTYQNQELPTGDYWYVIKLRGETDDRELIGNFTLLR